MTLTLLIDLDDTLLPYSTERFLPAYLQALSEHLAYIASPEKIQENLMRATYQAIAGANPSTTIKQSFDKLFYPPLDTTHEELKDSILDFYSKKYRTLSPINTPDPDVIDFIDRCFSQGFQVAIATNPIFPMVATYERMRWAGLPPESAPYSLITTYEDFHFAKPHPAYYMELLAQIGWPDSQIVVIGNDIEGDILPPKKLGLATYWTTDDGANKSCDLRHGAGPLKEFHAWLDIQTEESITPDLNGFYSSLETIRSIPAALQTLLRKIPNQLWNQRPSESSWSVTEILCHLRDVDSEVHLPRFEILRDAPSPYLTAIDADSWAEERGYNQQDGQQAFSDFIRARKMLVELIESLPESVTQKDIRHTIFGPISLNEIMRIAARHDRLHIQQLHALIHR